MKIPLKFPQQESLIVSQLVDRQIKSCESAFKRGIEGPIVAPMGVPSRDREERLFLPRCFFKLISNRLRRKPSGDYRAGLRRRDAERQL